MATDQALPGGATPLGPHDPRAIGAHTVLGKLGQGGMGAVYLGRGPRGLVAIKVIRDDLSADPGFRTRFAQEVAAGQRVASFCTAAMLDHGVDEGHPYLVTEFIEGPTLQAHVLRHGALTEGTLQGFAVGVAAALTAIHGAGLVHRDLKPSNVILSVSGPRVIDFGIARALDATTGVTRTGQLIGSPGWIAPEQLLADRATTAVDIYTWGCLVAFAALARHPYGTGAPIALASRILHGEPDLDGVPDTLLGLVHAAMAKDPVARPTAQQLLLSLIGATDASPNLPAQATRLVEETWHAGPAPGYGQQGAQPPYAGPGAAQGVSGQPGAAHAQPPYAGPEAGTGPGAGYAQGAQGPYAGPGSGQPGAAHAQGGYARPDAAGGPGQGGYGQPYAGPEAGTVPAGGAGHVGAHAAWPGGGGHDTWDAVHGQGHGPVTPPPGPGPATAPSGPGAAGRWRRNPTLLTAGTVAATVLLAGGVWYGLSDRSKDSASGGSAAANPLEAQGYKRVQLSGETGVGQARDDAGVRLAVGLPRCGGTEYQTKTANNRFCLIPLTAYNPSLTAESPRIPLNRQVLVTDDGTEIKVTEYPNGFLNNAPRVPAGGLISGMLLFDVPEDAALKSVRVYGANDSQGVEVPL
ncbi:protein kinase [Actinocorallia sp. API 0066]|uniref:serine/threonine protein kinase n=1 Tax=Actinocorallia sp. API 0066 TaxID=2896846 RepID=UPI0027E1ECD7|nr:protein kinase [Actinocorallia sp. API 0066]